MTRSIDEIFQTQFAGIGKSIHEDQRVVIESVLAGRNTLSLMRTGGGKSLCYWISGVALGGTTLVIFPLTALMDEQALKLRSHGLRVTVLHSGIPAREQYKQLIELYRGELPDFIFASPERLATDGFLEYVLRHQRARIKLVVIDEIHCISQWGHDFRPFYQDIPPFLDAVFGSDGWPTILGLTATLNPKDREQICQDFRILPGGVYRGRYLLRFLIHLKVVKVDDDPEKDLLFWVELARHRDEKVLVYIDNRRSGDRSTEGMCSRALSEGFKAAYFHGDMTSDEKAEVIRKFKNGEILTVFATSAFGMGIDIPDIRGVIHYRPPESVEQYYQQIGRVGRDGKDAWAIIYYSEKNIAFRKSHFIDRSFPKEEELNQAFAKLTAGRGRMKTLNYFTDEDLQTSYHYLLRCGALGFRGKAIQKIDVFAPGPGISLPDFEQYQSASRSGLILAVADKTQKPVAEIIENIYHWLARQQIRAERSPAKCLVIEQLADELSPDMLAAMLSDVEEKRQYRYELLDELAEVLDGFTDFNAMHQEIGRRLGVDKFELGRVQQTLSGTMVRSKSEVIIANLLTNHRIPFDYEKELLADGQRFAPDFTISVGTTTYYWEHLGRLDLEEYRQNWEFKKRWYERFFPGQLVTTEESSSVSRQAERLLTQLLGGQLPAHVSSRTAETTVTPESISPQMVQPDVGRDGTTETIRRVRLLTEGQTDWKHLKAAYRHLKGQGLFPNLDIQFQEDEKDMGDKELLAICSRLCHVRQERTTICLFDRDVPDTLRKVTDNATDFNAWGNRVYSVALPIPPHRQATPDISVEFYYTDNEIRRKDHNGRRLFIGTEFSQRTLRHQNEPLNCTDRNKVGQFKIIDSQVYDVSGQRDDEENVALSKAAFAENILNRVPPFHDFDFSPFEPLFTLLGSIAEMDAE